MTVKGKRGTLTKNFNAASVDMALSADGKSIRIDKWFGNRKELATVKTISTHIKNLIKGVTYGYLYKLKAVYAHFPINTVVSADKKSIDIRNFLGEKVVRTVTMLDGVTVEASSNKDELVLKVIGFVVARICSQLGL